MLIKFINKLVNNIKSKRDKIIIPKAIKAKNKLVMKSKRDKIIIPRAIIIPKAKNKNIIQLIRSLAVQILGFILIMLIYGVVYG